MAEAEIRWQHWALAVALLSSALVIGFLTWDPALFLDPALWVVAALVIAAEAMPVELPQRRGAVTVSFPLIFAGAMTLGPLAGLLLGTFATLNGKALRRQVPFALVADNQLQLGVAGGLSGVVYLALASLGAAPWWGWLGLVVGGCLYFIINAGSVTLSVAWMLRLPVRRYFRSTVLGTVPNFLALIPLAYVMVAVDQSISVVALAIFFLPLLVARQSFKMYSDMKVAYREMVVALTRALEAKDEYTAGHASRVSGIAMAIGRSFHMSDESVDTLEVVGLLHDIGKIAIPDIILQKPSKLTDYEYGMVKQHPAIGYDIVKHMSFLGDGVQWVLQHHERWNGKGYPQGLMGADIGLGARVVSVADATDAMLSTRPYRKTMRLIDACHELARCSGTQYDPSVVERFLRLAAEADFATEVLRQDKPITPEELETLLAESQAAAEAAEPEIEAERQRRALAAGEALPQYGAAGQAAVARKQAAAAAPVHSAEGSAAPAGTGSRKRGKRGR